MFAKSGIGGGDAATIWAWFINGRKIRAHCFSFPVCGSSFGWNASETIRIAGVTGVALLTHDEGHARRHQRGMNSASAVVETSRPAGLLILTICRRWRVRAIVKKLTGADASARVTGVFVHRSHLFYSSRRAAWLGSQCDQQNPTAAPISVFTALVAVGSEIFVSSEIFFSPPPFFQGKTETL